MNMMKNGVLAVLFLTMNVISVAAPAAADHALTLPDIFKNNTYQQKWYGPVRWMQDGNSYSTLERNPATDGEDIVRYDALTGARTVLITAKQLTPEGTKKPLQLDDYEWSKDGSRLLIFTNTKKVWRYWTRGDYWILDLRTGDLHRLGATVDRTTMQFAKFSPDGSRVAFVSKQNIYVENLKTWKTVQITHDGGADIINGTSDWMYEEEFELRDGFRWSPDGRSIAYWQMDTSGVQRFDMIDNVDSQYPKIFSSVPYPMVGTKLASARIGVVQADGGQTRWLAIAGDPRENYLPRMDFVPDSNQLLIQQLNRKQNTNRIWLADIRSMALKNVLTETDQDFVDIQTDLQWVDHDKSFIWTSERDGWRHLYKISTDGKSVSKLTKGDFDVVEVSGIDHKNGYVYYIASPTDFTQRYLYRSRLDGTGKPKRITPTSQVGQSVLMLSSNGQWGLELFQNVSTPPRISLVSLPDYRQVKMLEDNHALKTRYDELGLSAPQFFKVVIDDVDGKVALDAWMIKPRNFDSSKKYPLIIYVYGEPASSTVQDQWMGETGLWHQYLAQQGAIVVSIDNRGTATPRGKAWRNSIYGQIGILASRDQALATREILQMFPYIDASRVGIWGWSGGGQMTLNAMFRYPDLYTTGIAVAFVSEQRLYDAAYQERYMGLLSDNAKGYQDGSPITYAQNLKGALDNVHYQSYEMLVDKLIKENKVFDMMSYPMRSHCLCERGNTSLHLRETMARFWERNLLRSQ